MSVKWRAAGQTSINTKLQWLSNNILMNFKQYQGLKPLGWVVDKIEVLKSMEFNIYA